MTYNPLNGHGYGHVTVFTARHLASEVYAVVLCLPGASRCSTELAKRIITQATPRDSSWTLVFWRRRSWQNSNGVTPQRRR